MRVNVEDLVLRGDEFIVSVIGAARGKLCLEQLVKGATIRERLRRRVRMHGLSRVSSSSS